MNYLLKTLWPILTCLALLMIIWVFEANYHMVRKYFPDMSRWEYFLMGDKIRLVGKE